jgi:hypothetical protein
MAAYSVLGGNSEATIDQANIAMRSMPWYQEQMRSWAQDPGHPTLTSWQSDQIRRLAQANGFVVDEGNIEVDNHGNFNPKGHKLRNTMIVIGIAAATVATLGAAGVFAAGAAGAGAGAGGAAAGGAGAAGAAGGGGLLAATTTVPLATGTIAGGTGLGAAGLAGAGAAGAAGTGGLLASTTTVPLATGTVAGGTGLAGAGAGAAALPAGVALEGTAAGPGAASTVGGGSAATTAGTTAAAGTPASLVGKTLSSDGIAAAKDAGYTVNADGVVMDAANVAPDYIQAASGGSGLVSNLLKYVLPIGGSIASSLIAANASANASAAQTKYLEDALAYEKENDLYKRGVDAAAVAKEAQRYGDYQSRISPFIDNGISSNDRMSSLVGLPARTGASAGGAYSYSGGGGYGGSSSGGGSQGVAITPQITQKILDNYKALGLTPTGAGTGPTDTAYFAEKYAQTGGSTPDNDSYWFGPNGRIAKEARQAGVTFGTPSPTSPTSPTPPAPAPSSAPPITGAPVAKALVTLRAPDGSERDIPADQVDQYLSRGAIRV